MSQYFAGVVRKKYTLFCVAPDGASVEISSCYDDSSAKFGKECAEKVFQMMMDSFDMEEGFCFKILESMESAEDVPLSQIQKNVNSGNMVK